jgi:hypothetical protein
MTQAPQSTATPAPITGGQPTPQTVTPNQYHLHGGGIQVSYFPRGSGPITRGGPLVLTYQDEHRSLPFYRDDVRTVDVADLGMIVSVTLVTTPGVGSTTFSLLVPQVQLPGGEDSVDIKTEGITTIHRSLVGVIGPAQAETYRVRRLTGTASSGILPA